ncbi:MAG: hypothetical protein O9284_19150 [Steroidobacteraceae bacterium]|jgi:hypothetical protein|nr:hypothetical protein [Steroidobacteraceae bacterium]
MARPHRTLRGRIHYTSRAPGREGVERGREFWSLTVHGDGRRTLNSHCEIDDPPPVVRDVVLAFDERGAPADCAVRISVGDRFVGSSWFRFDGTQLECEAHTVLEGRVSQRLRSQAPLAMFGTHPIQADALLMAVADRGIVGRWQTFPELYLCSLDHRGATGPLLMRHPTGLRLALVGEERLTVGAGTFDAWHFRIGDAASTEPLEQGSRNEPGKHPPYDLWCTTDGDYVMLKAQVTGYMQTHYELVELHRT